MARTTLFATIDENGVTVPPFADVLNGLQDIYRGIYGSDIYIENDSQDGQWLGVLAAMADDSNQMAVATYNQFSPQTAVGVGLSQVVKVNGLRRLVPTNSTVPVLLIGVAGTIITGALASDIHNNQWAIDDTVIPVSGQIVVNATAVKDGAITLPAFSALTIITPIPGWQSITANATATSGSPVENDSSLRQRQSISTAKPAQTPLAAIVAAVANLTGVTRVRSYENDTGTDGFIPAHSIAIVVNGGDPIEVAQTIADKKAPGVSTYGGVTETVYDSMGVPNVINFSEEIDVGVFIIVNVKARTGYQSIVSDAIKQSVAHYISNAQIGDTLRLNKLWPAVSLVGPDAVAATGYTQDRLSAMSATYDILSIAHAYSDMVLTDTGALTPGTQIMTLADVGGILLGTNLYMLFDNGTIFNPVVSSNVTSQQVQFLPVVPSGRTVPSGSRVYVDSDLSFFFWQAPVCTADNVTVVVS